MPIECSICIEQLLQPGSRLSSTPCGHVYHRQCLLNWIENNENRGTCPVCRANFEPFSVIPLLTLEESTSSASNNPQPKDLEMQHKDTQSLLESVMNSLTAANEELKVKDAIIESLKKRIEKQEPPIEDFNYRLTLGNSPNLHKEVHYGNNCSCGTKEGNRKGSIIIRQDSDMSDLLNSLEDDELELNLSFL